MKRPKTTDSWEAGKEMTRGNSSQQLAEMDTGVFLRGIENEPLKTCGYMSGHHLSIPVFLFRLYFWI